MLLSRRRVHRAGTRDDLTDHDGLALVSEVRGPRHAIADGIDIPKIKARSSSEKGLDSTRMELLSSEVTCPREAHREVVSLPSETNRGGTRGDDLEALSYVHPATDARGTRRTDGEAVGGEAKVCEVRRPREDDGEGRLTEAVWYGDISGIGSLYPEELGQVHIDVGALPALDIIVGIDARALVARTDEEDVVLDLHLDILTDTLRHFLVKGDGGLGTDVDRHVERIVDDQIIASREVLEIDFGEADTCRATTRDDEESPEDKGESPEEESAVMYHDSVRIGLVFVDLSTIKGSISSQKQRICKQRDRSPLPLGTTRRLLRRQKKPARHGGSPPL